MVLLSKIDTDQDLEGSKIKVSEGTKVSIFEFNEDDDEVKEYLLAFGIAELNKIQTNPFAKWCSRIDKNGITNKTT